MQQADSEAEVANDPHSSPPVVSGCGHGLRHLLALGGFDNNLEAGWRLAILVGRRRLLRERGQAWKNAAVGKHRPQGLEARSRPCREICRNLVAMNPNPPA